MNLVTIRSIKTFFKEKNMKTSASAVQAINKEIEKLCLKAADQVLADNLKVVQGHHIPNIESLLDARKIDQL